MGPQAMTLVAQCHFLKTKICLFASALMSIGKFSKRYSSNLKMMLEGLLKTQYVTSRISKKKQLTDLESGQVLTLLLKGI